MKIHRWAASFTFMNISYCGKSTTNPEQFQEDWPGVTCKKCLHYKKAKKPSKALANGITRAIKTINS